MPRELKDDFASVARLAEVTVEGITIDDAFIQQQEAIMRDFGNNTVEEMGTASSLQELRRTFKNNPTSKIPLPPPSQDRVDDSNMSSESLDTNFSDFSNDDKLIREQRRILDEIQWHHEAKPSTITKDELYNTTQNLTPKKVDSLTIPNKSSKTIPAGNNKGIASSQDRVTRLINGKRLRVKGTQHTCMSIARGTAIIVTCPCCQTVLQVDASTKLLYCTCCQHVSPIELATSPTNHGNKVGLYDNQIAVSIQRQEIDVACTRKLSKMEN